MTVKELLETLHCGVRKNVSYRFYEWETKRDFVFQNEAEIYNFIAWANGESSLLEREIEYFSFKFDDFKFELSVRLKVQE